MIEEGPDLDKRICARLLNEGLVVGLIHTGGGCYSIEIERPDHRNNVMVGPFDRTGDSMDESLYVQPEYYDRNTGEELPDRDDDDYVEATTVDGVVNAVLFYVRRGGVGS